MNQYNQIIERMVESESARAEVREIVLCNVNDGVTPLQDRIKPENREYVLKRSIETIRSVFGIKSLDEKKLSLLMLAMRLPINVQAPSNMRIFELIVGEE